MTTPNPIPAAALAAHMAVLGKTGSGKTSTAKLAVEQAVASGARVCILDPIKSDWWGLTSSADGRRAGLPFQVLGGPHGHVPLTSSAGAAVAELVASGDLPLSIVDMALFEPGGLQAFFNAFAPALLQRMRGVLHLVIEEAHLFAPKERAGIGAETHAIHWAKTLATAGRSKGIRLILATQRTQALHNALLGSCETMIAHRLTAPADQFPIQKWLKANVAREVYAEVESSLAGLPTGTAWLCSGEAGIFKKVAFPRISTFDNTATPTGELADRKVKMAAIDVGKLRALIGEKVAEAEASDPAKLKARIAVLEKAAAGKREKGSANAARGEAAERATQGEIEAARQAGEGAGYDRGLRDGEAGGRQAGIKAAAAHVRHFSLSWRAPSGQRSVVLESADSHPVGEIFADAILEMIGEHDGPLASQPEVVPTRPARRALAPAAARPNGHAARAAAALPPARPNGGAPAAATNLGAERRPLAALASAHPAGMTEAQWAVAAGMKRSGGTWGTYKSRLRVAGAIEAREGQWYATIAGLELVGGTVAPLPAPGAELVEFWIDRIPGVGPMLRELARRYPRAVERGQLADALDMAASGGTFGTYLSRLSAAGLIEKSAAGVRAAPALMEGPQS